MKRVSKVVLFIGTAMLIVTGSFVYALPINFSYSEQSGLSAAASINVSGGQLVVILTNTSTGVPTGFSNSDQLLTSFAFSLPSGTSITGGYVQISPGSFSENFDHASTQLTGGDDVSTEWGYGNSGGTGLGTHLNYFTSMAAGAIQFTPPPPNLDGPEKLDGPQGGLTNDIVPLGGLGAINDSVAVYMNIGGIDLSILPNANTLLSFLENNGAIFEFGSDAFFGTSSIIPIPEPSTIFMLIAGFALIGFKKLITR